MFPQRRKGAKKSHFRIRQALRLCAFAGVCFYFSWVPSATSQKPKPNPYGPPAIIAVLKDKSVSESSGLTASRTTRGAYWTHNDSGDGPFIYGFDNSGAPLGTFRVTGAQARDWEDMASGPGPQRGKSYLYLGDIGDNNGVRAEIVVYRVLEPTLTPATRNFTKKQPGTTEPAEAIRLRYPDGKFDAEALLVHPVTGRIYIMTKVVIANPIVYEAVPPFDTSKAITMTRLGEVHVPSLFGGVITGGAISPDGRHIALCDYFQGYELTLPPASKDFNDIWKQRMIGFDLGKRKQGESITYRLDGKAFLATSERKDSPLIQVLKN